MKENKCILCGSNLYEVVYDFSRIHKDSCQPFVYKITQNSLDNLPPRIVRCRKCGFIYANPQEEVEKIISAYQQMEDDLYLAEEKGRRQAAKIVLKRISKFGSKGRILEIGCSAGFFLDEARQLGWQGYGIDLSHWAVEHCQKKLKLENVIEGSLLENTHFAYNYFDAVVMLDVIEHLHNPRQVLEEIRRILKPGGILCVSTPDINSFLSRFLKAQWWGIQKAHLSYFSRKTLEQMLIACGFKVIKFKSHVRVFSADYWRTRLESYNKNLICRLAAVFFGLMPKNTLIKLNLGDQIEVYAKKRRALKYINDDERREIGEKKKMKIIVVLPAYNAAKTLAFTIRDIPKDIIDDIILVDDASKDNTVEVARALGLKVFVHPKNKGYGANQKTCYQKALQMGAEIVVMVHPDYQYDPRVIPELIKPIEEGRTDAVFGSRMMKGGALEGGMPLWKHNANILLTALENVVFGTYLTEYHSGFRAYSAKYLNSVNFMSNSDGFIFDTEIIVQGLLHYLKIEEVPIRTRYFDEASTIKFIPSVVYGLGILKTIIKYILHKKGIIHLKQFE